VGTHLKKIMKYIFSIILLGLLLINCNSKKVKAVNSKVLDEKILSTEKDTIVNYWALEYDTIKSSKPFEFEKVKYFLDLKTYSLNDSLIKRDLSSDDNMYFDISHSRITRLTLTNKNIRTDLNIKKKDFKKLLDSVFYANCNLLSTELGRISQDTIYLNTELAIPDTDVQWKVGYYYLIKNHRLARQYLDSKEYVGQ
ncbi:hypothetical protein, partial [uncultured Maribacter sp.]|uniref:hypothetical protein n=1 Tax=uncultured Maribacter sp. TaxID=431308 RepID=UPI00260EDB06